ncbi:tryptamine hydroxycinnamoyltransferase 2 [Iris pallida]|uniref:Tryptamine hydroxycinnamoyltransferase 2 n=1 Tax=Iris pallida TaxID=29817 RepID=A0AAX6EZV7_IRIPA|nr:tryptamine hydroxycinnamoyltransferase 2 [Iris pallida]
MRFTALRMWPTAPESPSRASSPALAFGRAQRTTLPKYSGGTTGLILVLPLTATRTRVISSSGRPRTCMALRQRWARRTSNVVVRKLTRFLSCAMNSPGNWTTRFSTPEEDIGSEERPLECTSRCSNLTCGGSLGTKRELRSRNGAGPVPAPRVALAQAWRNWPMDWPSATGWQKAMPMTRPPQA